MAESVGNQNYHGLFVQLTKRFSNGFQFNANYTVSRSRDDAPEENGPGATAQSDPSNRAVDRGNSDGDVTGVFNLSILARPSLRVASRFLDAVLNNNQLGVIVMADTGENFNITSADLNRDGVLGSDRPVGVPRNSGRLPAYLGVNARYSRFFRLGERLSSEFYAEATNVFNHKSVSSYNSTTLTASSVLNSQVNPLTGNLLGPLPDFRNLSVTFRESRQLQLGVRLHF